MTWRAFEALPPYFGGKRKLCPRIFKEIARVFPRDRWPTARFVDPFLGGGAVSLYAKGQGFAVECADLARRSVLVGEALVANDDVRLEREDLLLLCAPTQAASDYMQRCAAPNHLTIERAGFFDNAWAAAERLADPCKRAMARLLLVRYLFWLRPLSKFSSPGCFNAPFAERRYDDIKATYKQAIAANGMHPARALAHLRPAVNHGVFRGQQACTVQLADAGQTVAGAAADVLYLDPPYAGTLRYEKEYELLDGLFGQELASNPFSAAQGLEQLGQLLAACGKHKLWVISYGNAVATLDQVCAVVERYRPTRAVELAYGHLTAVATKEKSAGNREFIILAGEGVS